MIEQLPKNGLQVHNNEINRHIKKTEERQQRLLDAIETGTIELDETTQQHAQQLKAFGGGIVVEDKIVTIKDRWRAAARLTSGTSRNGE